MGHHFPPLGVGNEGCDYVRDVMIARGVQGTGCLYICSIPGRPHEIATLGDLDARRSALAYWEWTEGKGVYGGVWIYRDLGDWEASLAYLTGY